MADGLRAAVENDWTRGVGAIGTDDMALVKLLAPLRREQLAEVQELRASVPFASFSAY